MVSKKLDPKIRLSSATWPRLITLKVPITMRPFSSEAPDSKNGVESSSQVSLSSLHGSSSFPYFASSTSKMPFVADWFAKTMISETFPLAAYYVNVSVGSINGFTKIDLSILRRYLIWMTAVLPSISTKLNCAFRALLEYRYTNTTDLAGCLCRTSEASLPFLLSLCQKRNAMAFCDGFRSTSVMILSMRVLFPS